MLIEKHKILIDNVEKLAKGEAIVSANLKADEITSDSLELYVKKYPFEGGLSKYLHEVSTKTEKFIIRGPVVRPFLIFRD